MKCTANCNDDIFPKIIDCKILEKMLLEHYGILCLGHPSPSLDIIQQVIPGLPFSTAQHALTEAKGDVNRAVNSLLAEEGVVHLCIQL